MDVPGPSRPGRHPGDQGPAADRGAAENAHRQERRPLALKVMAEWDDGDPAWDTDSDHYGPVDLAALGVSADLVARLRAWKARFEAVARTDFRFADAEEERAWQAEGLRLAHALQDELFDVEVSYVEDGDDRPLRERRGR